MVVQPDQIRYAQPGRAIASGVAGDLRYGRNTEDGRADVSCLACTGVPAIAAFGGRSGPRHHDQPRAMVDMPTAAATCWPILRSSPGAIRAGPGLQRVVRVPATRMRSAAIRASGATGRARTGGPGWWPCRAGRRHAGYRHQTLTMVGHPPDRGTRRLPCSARGQATAWTWGPPSSACPQSDCPGNSREIPRAYPSPLLLRPQGCRTSTIRLPTGLGSDHPGMDAVRVHCRT